MTVLSTKTLSVIGALIVCALVLGFVTGAWLMRDDPLPWEPASRYLVPLILRCPQGSGKADFVARVKVVGVYENGGRFNLLGTGVFDPKRGKSDEDTKLEVTRFPLGCFIQSELKTS